MMGKNNLIKLGLDIFENQIKTKNMENVSIEFINVPLKFSGYIKPKFENKNYKIRINLRDIKEDKETNKFYLTNSIIHELEHIKSFEYTKKENFYNFSHFMALMQFITYANIFNISFDKYNFNIENSMVINKLRLINYDILDDEIIANLEGYKGALELNKNNLSQEKINIFNQIIKILEILKQNLYIMYDENRMPFDKFYSFIINTEQYIQKNPSILKTYKILNNIFDENSKIKNIYNLYLTRNEENSTFYDDFILNCLIYENDENKIENYFYDEKFKQYIENLINLFYERTKEFIDNIDNCKIFIKDKDILIDNLKFIEHRINILDKFIIDNDLKVKSRIIFLEK